MLRRNSVKSRLQKYDFFFRNLGKLSDLSTNCTNGHESCCRVSFSLSEKSTLMFLIREDSCNSWTKANDLCQNILTPDNGAYDIHRKCVGST